MFRLFRRKGTAIHTMDLVLLISAVGTAFAIARGPITKYLGGWFITQTKNILDLGGAFEPASDPNEDIQRLSDSSDLDDQVAGFTSQDTFFDTHGEGHSVALAGDLDEVLDPAIAATDYAADYAARQAGIGDQDPNAIQTPDYVIPIDELPDIPMEQQQ